jgi:SNF2 family DNA or RNA helicase
VHAFVTEGTLEERIEEILARKGSLAGILKDGSEFWNAVKLDE